MRRALALTGLAAWIMIQVPLVLCDSACAASTTPVFLMSLHGCHDVESDEHASHCAHDCCGQDEQERSDDEPDEHTLVLAQGLNAGTVVVLPSPGCMALGFVDESASATRLILEPTSFDAEPVTGGTSPVPDPVSLSDRLLV